MIWLTVALLWVAYFLNYIDRQIVFSIFPALKSDLGFSDTQLGLIGSVFTWMYSLCMVAGGRAADLFRRDRLIVGSLILWSLATLGTSASHSVTAFLLWRAAMGVTEAVYVPAAVSLIASLHGAATRSRALGIHMTAQMAGIATGGWYGGWAADHIGWRNGFVILTATGIAYAFVLLVGFRKLSDTRSENQPTQGSYKRVFGSLIFKSLLALFFAFCIMIWMIYAWLPSFIFERYHLSMTLSGLTATLYLQASTVAGILTGALVGDRMATRVRGARFYLVGVGALLSSPFAWLIFESSSLVIVKAASVGFGFFGGWLMANIFAASYDVVRKEDYGLAVGVMNFVGGLAGGTAIFTVGYLRTSVGVGVLMAFAAGLAVATGMLVISVTWFSIVRQPSLATKNAN